MADEQESIAIPLVEERVTVGKRVVETGEVRVRTVIEERSELAGADLLREKVAVERVPRNEEVTVVPPVREEDGVTIVPVVEERLVVEKKLFLVEEIRLVRRSVTERLEMPVTLRAQRAVVEREESSGEPQKQE
jgi:uncharacterized protein (TIGR02271 family)